MSEPVKKKMCWNCEGSVAKQLETCPYCGVYLSPTESDSQSDERNLLSPPYPRESLKSEAIATSEERASSSEGEDFVLAPLIFLLSGTTFLLFGLTLWLFSEGGRLTLSWNADWSLIFMLLALPLLFFGLRRMLRLE